MSNEKTQEKDYYSFLYKKEREGTVEKEPGAVGPFYPPEGEQMGAVPPVAKDELGGETLSPKVPMAMSINNESPSDDGIVAEEESEPKPEDHSVIVEEG